MISTPKIRGGAPGGTRTPTPLRVPDFESGASTGSATGARYMFKLSGRVCQQSAHRFRRPPTSFHEVGTVAKTDCKAKAVTYRRARFPNAQGHGGDEAGVARWGFHAPEQHIFAHSRTRTQGGLPSLSHSTPVEEEGRRRSGQSRQRQRVASRVDRMGANIA